MAIGFAVCGFLLFAIGSIAIAHGGAVITRDLGFSPLTIGLVVIATAASMPALFVLWQAKTVGATDLAVGGVVGGAIFALTLLLGLCAQVRPLECPPKVMVRDFGVLLLVAVSFLVLAIFGIRGRLAGAVLLAIFFGYLALSLYADRRRAAAHSVVRAHAERLEMGGIDISGGVFVAALGVIAMMLGAHLTLTGGQALAHQFDLPQYAIGLTVVAACVSLPELFVVLAGASRGRSDVLVGYTVILGIFSLACMLGVGLLVLSVRVSRVFIVDGLFLVGFCVMVPLTAAVHWRLSRPRGVLLILCYAVYLLVLALRLHLLSLALPQF
jgi:cation:H+ antiporter